MRIDNTLALCIVDINYGWHKSWLEMTMVPSPARLRMGNDGHYRANMITSDIIGLCSAGGWSAGHCIQERRRARR